MNAELQVVPTTLSGIEIELGSVAKRVEKDQWRIAELLYAAKGYFDNDKSFKKWVADRTGYTYKTADQYIDTYDRFKDHKQVACDQRSEKPIPFSKLKEVSAQNINHRTVEKVVRKLVSDKPPTTEEVRKIVREAKPTYIPPAITYNEVFEDRVTKTLGKFTLKGEVLFDIAPEACSETVRIIAKYWKGKYHPDKSGNAEIFDAICKAEERLLKARGEK